MPKPRILLSKICLSNIDANLVYEEDGEEYVDVVHFVYAEPNRNGSVGMTVEALPPKLLKDGYQGQQLGYLFPKPENDDE
jgi:hypothetical protein